MQRKKNIRLLVLLISTVLTILGLQLAKKSTSNLDISKLYFQLEEQQEITDVYLKKGKVNNHFSFKNGRWMVNDSLQLDQSMRDVFFSVLSKMEVRRPVANDEADSIAEFLTTKGVHTVISFGDEIIKDYWVGGNNNLEVTWVMDNNTKKPYQIHIPGYQSYLAGIFMVPTKDWRSRFIFNINFALIKEIRMTYFNKKNGFDLKYNNGFFHIDNFDADSTKVANFLDQVAFLQADRFLSTNEVTPEYDSLIHNNALFAQLLLVKSFGDNQQIEFYNYNNKSPYILAKTYDGTLCLFEYRRIKGIFKDRGEFKRSDSN